MHSNTQIYKVKSDKISGENYIDVERVARQAYRIIAGRTKRNPYIRSAYFHKDKIFLSLFWQHLMQKHEGDRKRRLRYFNCAIELLRHSTIPPETKQNPLNKNELLHRFTGQTIHGDIFIVHIAEDKRKGNKFLISVFPPKQQDRTSQVKTKKPRKW